MPKVRIKEGQTAFINGTLYRSGGVAQIGGPKHSKNPAFVDSAMEWAPDDAKVNIRGNRNVSTKAYRNELAREELAAQNVKAQDDEGDAAIVAAVGRLDHGDDAHWTKEGLADLRAVTEYAGKRVTREELDAVFPDFKRRAA